uniref:Polycystin 1 like 3, transient receptor potential channel interacting n=1 Tax=Pelusios castaneus TaxID=367368 RepID=A0A8C8RV32_9SAUR
RLYKGQGRAGQADGAAAPWGALHNACYEFVRHQRSFWAAQAWCQARRGRLAHLQRPAVQEVLSSRLAEGEKWWVGRAEQPGAEEPGEGSPAHRAAEAPTAPPAGCSYIIRDSGSIWARGDTCAQELYFICQFGECWLGDGLSTRPGHYVSGALGAQPQKQGGPVPLRLGDECVSAAGGGPGEHHGCTPKDPGAALGLVTVCDGGFAGRQHHAEQVTGPGSELGRAQRAAASILTLSLPVPSCNASTLPLGSYRLAQPLPLTLAFPSTPALAALLSNHSRVQVGVTVLAVNPFKHWDRTAIRSVGNIIVAAKEELIAVRDLPEDIEIGLWRDEHAETSPSGLNASTKEFVIELNVTSIEGTLIVRVLPSVPLVIELCLGQQHPPNNTHCLLNTTLPTGRGQHQGDNYTWVLSSARLQPSPGPYHITAVARRSTEQELLSHVTYTITALATPVLQVGPQSTISSTQCLCNHLTFFGSSVFVVPRTVNVQDTGKLLQNIANNPVGVALLASLLVVHGAAGIWAWRRDRADVRKVKVTVLADSDPRAHVRYVVQVFTGYRRGAATTAKVVLTLYGSEGRSEPHCLQDAHKPVFERGGLDVFLVTTHRPLGDLHSIRLWHDNSGPSPSWYVRQVVVSDVTARKKWHFLCSTWLAVDLGDCQLDQVFPAASLSELLSCRQLFHAALVEKFTQEHLWLSVLTRCPWDPFTRVQRLACCLTLLLCTMLVNLLFWRVHAGLTVACPAAGHGLLTWSELVASVQTALLLFPINLGVVRIFQLVPPPDLPLLPAGNRLPRASAAPQVPPPTHTPATGECLSPRRPRSLRFPQHQPGCQPATEPQGTAGAAQRASGARTCQVAIHWPAAFSQLLAQATPPITASPCFRAGRSFPILEPTEQKAAITSRLPKETVFVCWVTVAAASLASAFFTILLSLQLDRQQATSWVVSMLLSLLQNIFIVQPLKVSGLTLLFSLVLKRVLWQDKGKEQQLQRILALLGNSHHHRGREARLEVPSPSCMEAAAGWESASLEQALSCLHLCLAVQVSFLAALLVVCYMERSPDELYFKQAIRQSLTRKFSHVHRLGDFYTWAHGTLLPSLYGPTPGQSHPLSQGIACPRDPLGLPRWWRAWHCLDPSLSPGQADAPCLTRCKLKAWPCFHIPTDTLALQMTKRPRPGMPVPRNAVHLALCCAPSSLCPRSKGIPEALSNHMTHVQARQLKQQKWRYCCSQRKVLDVSVILISLAAIGVYIKRCLLQDSVMQKYQQDRSRFVSFYEAVKMDSALTCLLAFLVALTTVKLWTLLRLNPRMHVISRTLQAAWQEVVGFLLVLLVLLAGYSMACNLLFGWSLENYKTVVHSAVTIVELLIGIFNYDMVLNLDPILGSLLITTSVVSMLYVVINLFVSALLTTFSEERQAALVRTWLGLSAQSLRIPGTSGDRVTSHRSRWMI